MSDPIVIRTQQENNEELLRQMAAASGGELKRGDDGILRLVHPITPR